MSIVRPLPSTSLCALWLLFAAASCQREFPEPWRPSQTEPSLQSVQITSSYHDALSAPETPTLQAQSFLGANACGACHSTHQAEWQSSPHGRAMRDPIYQRLIAAQREQLGSPEQDTFCVQCHSPIALRAGQIEPGFDFDELPGLAKDGVSCEVCHRTSRIERPFNAGLNIEQSNIIQGPIRDPSPPHPAQYNEIFKQSELCASCHEVRSASGVKLESPFEEWRDSPAAADARTCQSCHMPGYRGQAARALGSPSRELHRHNFSAIEDSTQPCDGDEPGKLCAAASVEAELTCDARAKPVLKVRVHNRTDGHNLPTGSVFFRQLWLSVVVRDAAGNEVFHSGQLDDELDLDDDPQLQTFSGSLRDADGQPTLFPWAAAALASNALGPLETREVSYQLEDAPQLTAEVTLRFRPFAPRLLRAVGADDLIDSLWIADLDTATTRCGP